MKTFHTLKMRWLLLAMVGTTVIGEVVAWQVTRLLNWRFPAVAVAAVCVGLVAAFAAEFYDGRE